MSLPAPGPPEAAASGGAGAAPPRFPRVEAALLAAALIAFVGILLATSLRMQPVWLDEVTVEDPAVNLHFGKGFTSTGWQYQTKEEFWASNAPLHQILLFHWIRAFGFNPLSARSISFVLMAFTVALLWFSSWRLGLVPSPQGRLLLVFLLIGGAGITFDYAMGRYDLIGIFLLALALTVASLRIPDWIRSMILLVVGILIPIAGVNLIPYGLLMGTLLWLFLRNGFQREAVCLGAGAVLGLFALYVLYVTNGVEKILLVSAGGHGLAGTLGEDTAALRQSGMGGRMKFVLTHAPLIVGRRLVSAPDWYFSDRSFVVVLGILLVRAVALKRSGQWRMKSAAAFGLAVAVAVPLIMGLLRNYPFYYSWMAYLPLSLCTLSACEPLWEKGGPVGLRAALVAGVLLAAWQGLPHRLLAAQMNPLPDYSKVEAFVEQHVRKDDRAYADFEAYYPMRRKAVYVLLPTYEKMMSEAERRELSVLVVRQQNIDGAIRIVGGDWVPVSRLELPEPYDLTVLRRR